MSTFTMMQRKSAERKGRHNWKIKEKLKKEKVLKLKKILNIEEREKDSIKKKSK